MSNKAIFEGNCNPAALWFVMKPSKLLNLLESLFLEQSDLNLELKV